MSTIDERLSATSTCHGSIAAIGSSVRLLVKYLPDNDAKEGALQAFELGLEAATAALLAGYGSDEPCECIGCEDVDDAEVSA